VSAGYSSFFPTVTGVKRNGRVLVSTPDIRTSPLGPQDPRAEQVNSSTLEACDVALLPLGGARECAHPCKINHQEEDNSSRQLLCTTPWGWASDEFPALLVLQPLPDPLDA
jgi:hypothetical protein